MEIWMKIWRFLDENNDIDSLMDISRRMKISYPSVLDGIKILEDVGYINVVGNASRKRVIKTQKFLSTRKNILCLYDSIIATEDKK